MIMYLQLCEDEMNHLPLKVKVSTLNNYGCHLQYLKDDLVLYFCKNTE